MINVKIYCDECEDDCGKHGSVGAATKAALKNHWKENSGKWFCRGCLDEEEARLMATSYEIKVPFRGHHNLTIKAKSRAEARRIADLHMDDSDQDVVTNEPDFVWIGKAR